MQQQAQVDESDRQTARTQAQQAFDQHHLAAGRTTLMGLLLVFAVLALLWDDSSRAGLLTWAGLMVVAAPTPLIFKKLQINAETWLKYLVPLEIVLGTIWSSVAVLAMPADPALQAVVGAILVGILLGTPFVLAQFITAYLAFTIPTALWGIIGLALWGEGAARTLIVIISIAWLQGLLLAKAQQKLQNDLAESLTENQRLVSSLEDRNAAVVESNVELATSVTIADRLARVDHLTQVSNRLEFDEVLSSSLEQLRSGGIRQLTVAFLDLDKFKAVNDSFGHKAGDQLLQTVGRRIQAQARSNETVARIGGDEFVIISPDADDQDVRSRLASVFSKPFHVEGKLLDVDASIGITSTRSVITADELIRRADRAQYEVKRSGRDSEMVGPQQRQF